MEQQQHINLENAFPASMRRGSDVLIRSQIDRDIADHAERSSGRRNWYDNEMNLFETSLLRLIGM